MEIALSSATPAKVPVGATVIIPVGSLEPRAPHLPLDADSEVAGAIAEMAAKMLRRRRLKVVVAPVVAYGAGSEDRRTLPGAVCLGSDLLHALLSALVRAAATWAQRCVIVNASCSNELAVASVAADLRVEGIDVAWVGCERLDLQADGARMKTSLMLHLRPWEVRTAQALRRADSSVLAEIAGGVEAPQPLAIGWNRDAVLRASADEGREALDRMAWIVSQEVVLSD